MNKNLLIGLKDVSKRYTFFIGLAEDNQNGGMRFPEDPKVVTFEMEEEALASNPIFQEVLSKLTEE